MGPRHLSGVSPDGEMGYPGCAALISLEGLTLDELVKQTQLSKYALKVLLEASLSAGTVLVNKDTDRYTISKTGWFLLNDPATRVNIDFNHDVNLSGACSISMKH